MAENQAVSSPASTSPTPELIACPSYSTAIVILPPQHLHNEINILRSVYDKSHPRWAPHITLSIPFVAPSDLSHATALIRELFFGIDLLKPWKLTFSKTGFFEHKDSATVYLKPDEESERRLRQIREKLERVFMLGKSEDGVFIPHLTIGQTSQEDSVQLLREKAEMLLPISWTFEGLVVINKNELDGGRMEVFATIPESHTTLVASASAQPLPHSCYSYNESTGRYEVYQSTSLFDVVTPPSTLTISTYNILHSPLQPQTPGSPRLTLLLDILLNQPSTILILQEVTDTAWQYFLSSPHLRAKFPYLSAPSDLPLPNNRNIVILATIPFKAYYLPLVTAHKPALIADFTTFLLTGIHLTSGLREEKLSSKHKELSKLTSYLSSTDDRPIILAGDFNIPKQGREHTAALPKVLEVLERYEDTWFEGEETFVPERNRFALEGVKTLVAQRYDRILCTKGWAKVLRREIFGQPEREETLASDHWGISITLNSSPETHTPETIDTSVGTNLEKLNISDVPETKWTDNEILTVLHAANIIPSSTHDTALLNSISLLQSILSPLNSLIPFLLQPLGSFTLGAHTRSSDLDILAVSTISPKIFWTLFLQHLYRFKLTNEGGRVKLLRIIKEAKAPMVELLVDGFSFEVLYCAAGRLLPIWDQVPTLSPEDDRLKLPALTLKALSSYRDISILRYVPNIPNFRLARRAFKYFCSQRGIYGAKYGYLGGFAVTLLISGICRLLPASATTPQILAAAIKKYAEFPWEEQILLFPGTQRGREKREERDVMFVASIHRPVHNVTRNASKSTLQVIRNELRKASETISRCSFESLCTWALDDFLLNYKSFIKVQCSYWGNQPAEGRAWITWIESRLVILLVNLSKEFKQIGTRLWPARFADKDSDDIHGTYIIGVSGAGMDEGTFRTVLRDVERTMKGEETETPDRWVSVNLVRGKEIISENLEIDTRIFDGEEVIVLDEEDLEDEESEDLPAMVNLTTPEVKGGKLRPSHDIYNRLLWDARYTADEYLVGYEDRFKGVREMPLTSWKRELSDEEFIPFHRVVYFREKGVDGEIVWDRRTRVDLVFGSGQSSLDSGL